MYITVKLIVPIIFVFMLSVFEFNYIFSISNLNIRKVFDKNILFFSIMDGGIHDGLQFEGVKSSIRSDSTTRQ